MKSKDIKILIINPNSSEAITRGIQECAEVFADGDFQVETVGNPSAPEYLSCYEDRAIAAAGMIEIIKANEDKYDAFLIGAHCDPNLDAMKEITKKPVVGMGESSMKFATMLGHSFSVVSANLASVQNKYNQIHTYHLDGYNASVRAPKEGLKSFAQVDVVKEQATKAIEEDLAEVIVLGSGGMCGVAESMTADLGVPVLDGIICGLIVAVGMVKAGLSTSKVYRFGGKK